MIENVMFHRFINASKQYYLNPKQPIYAKTTHFKKIFCFKYIALLILKTSHKRLYWT